MVVSHMILWGSSSVPFIVEDTDVHSFLEVQRLLDDAIPSILFVSYFARFFFVQSLQLITRRYHSDIVFFFFLILQDSFEVEYTLEGDSTPSITNCTESPCEFSVSGEPGQLYTVSVYAVKQSFRSEPAVVQHNTGIFSCYNS